MKPQDIVVLVKLFIWPNSSWTIGDISKSIKLSKSETHAAIKRCALSGFINQLNQRPSRSAIEEFLIHGLKYVFPAEIGTRTRGIPTAHSVKPMSDLIVSNDQNIYVWPYDKGTTRGLSITPLYWTVPVAVLNDNLLYEYLSLLDSIRIGKAREYKIAKDELVKRIRAKK